MSSQVAASLINECKMTIKAIRNKVKRAKTKTNNLQSCCSSLKNSSQLASLIANPTFLATAARYSVNKINVLRQHKDISDNASIYYTNKPFGAQSSFTKIFLSLEGYAGERTGFNRSTVSKVRVTENGNIEQENRSHGRARRRA